MQSIASRLAAFFLCARMVAKLDAPVREILRAALAQARYMQVPVSAAVNEAVKLTRTFKKSSASGLVNAVLRKACGYDLDAAVFTDEIQRLMVLGSAGLDVAKFLHTILAHYYTVGEIQDIADFVGDSLALASKAAVPFSSSCSANCSICLVGVASSPKFSSSFSSI